MCEWFLWSKENIIEILRLMKTFTLSNIISILE